VHFNQQVVSETWIILASATKNGIINDAERKINLYLYYLLSKTMGCHVQVLDTI